VPGSLRGAGVPYAPGGRTRLDRVENNGVATVIVEDASRFARELVVQELGIALLAKRGVRLLTASGDDLTDSDDLGRKMMRQVAGAFAEYEKGRLVAKLRSGRERRRKETRKKVGGGSRTWSSGRRSLPRRSDYAEQIPRRESASVSRRSAIGWRMPATSTTAVSRSTPKVCAP
jgi:DNA invertase Pin-like site-specific DNA recombinase